ncbi:MAG: hypothetical protein WBI07_14385 [Mobilitalea sp.]
MRPRKMESIYYNSVKVLHSVKGLHAKELRNAHSGARSLFFQVFEMLRSSIM